MTGQHKAWSTRTLPGLVAVVTLNGAALAAPREPARPRTCSTQQETPGSEPALDQGQSEIVGSSEVNVSEFQMVDILAQNDRVTNVLQKLAILSRRNIIPSNKVERVVNATIYGVPFYDALGALLEPNGLSYVEVGEFIYVYTFAELASLRVGAWALVTKVIHLDYLRPNDARDYVQKMLSSDGHIEITKDLDAAGGEEAAGGGAVPGGEAVNAAGGTEIYTPALDQYDLRNAIIVQDVAENVERIEAFLREMDTRPSQVLLEATIIQTSLSEQNSFGVDFALLGGEDFIDFFNVPIGGPPIGFQSSTTSTTDSMGGMSETTTVATPPNDSGFVIMGAGNTGAGNATIRAGYVGNVGVFVKALEQVTDVTLLSNPKILALNRQRSKAFVGKKVGYLETTVVENQVLQTVKFIDTGIVLDIRPFILQDGRIRLELSPKVSSVTFRPFESSDGVVQEIPDEVIQTVSTDVLVPEGYTAVLGGLFREDTTRVRRQVPWLGDLPLLGVLFRGHDDSVGQVEIIFLIKPTVMRDDMVIAQGQRGTEYGERVRVGSRLGLLPWSRERQSSRLNLEAEQLLSRGKANEALWKIRRSLELHPQQPEVIRLLEELEDDPMWWPSRSYLEHVIDEGLDEGGRNEAAGSAEEPPPEEGPVLHPESGGSADPVPEERRDAEVPEAEPEPDDDNPADDGGETMETAA